QLTRIVSTSGKDLCRRCPYHAIVMKTLLANRSRIVIMAPRTIRRNVVYRSALDGEREPRAAPAELPLDGGRDAHVDRADHGDPAAHARQQRRDRRRRRRPDGQRLSRDPPP